MNLDNLTREQLIKLAKDLIVTHEEYYNQVVSKELSIHDAFYRCAGGFQVIRWRNGIELLYKTDYEWPKLFIHEQTNKQINHE